MKAITVRLPDDVWRACIHRLVDEEMTWQGLIEPICERYAAGEDVSAIPVPPSPAPEAPTPPEKDKKPRPKTRR